MVTAGVYMIARTQVLFTHAPETLAIVGAVGAATALLAGTIAVVQHDIKRVLAYSTVSQLGFMFLAMGVGAYGAGIFHLFTHAFFKALLFLGAGAVIHALGGEQDIRRMGGLRTALPLTYWTFVVAALAIAGVPGLAGFFSKDEILFRTFIGGHTWLWAVGLATSMLTAVYMFRLVFLTFHGERAAPPAAGADDLPRPRSTHLHDAPPAMALALVVLAFGSLVAGYAGLPHALGGSNRFEQFLAPVLGPEPGEAAGDAAAAGEEQAATELGLMALSSAVAVGGVGVAAFFFLRRRDRAAALAMRFPGLHRLLLHKYYVDELYDAAIVQPIRIASAEGLWKRVDVRFIDGAVNRLGMLVAASGERVRLLQTGSVRAYAASLLIGVVLILGYYLWR
jgi:NADH-quinone oxidoreductase subunit L